MENLMTPFGFPLMGLFGSIFGGKMGGDNAPDVAAQKRRFGIKNGSTMPMTGVRFYVKSGHSFSITLIKMRIASNRPIEL